MASSSASFNFYSLVMVPSPIYFHFKSDLRFTSLQLYRPRCSVLSPCVGIPTELHQHGTPDYLDLLFSDRANSCKYRSSLHKISCLAAELVVTVHPLNPVSFTDLQEQIIPRNGVVQKRSQWLE